MSPEEITNKLKMIAYSQDLALESGLLIDGWSQSPDAFDAVEPIMRFMEDNPALDFGMPGPLVHFVEMFHRRGYEEKLIDSVNRRPTEHTVWMLNRLINGTDDPRQRQLESPVTKVSCVSRVGYFDLGAVLEFLQAENGSQKRR